MAYREQKRIRFKNGWSFSSLVRKALAAWILTAALQYLLLPQSLRDLSGVEGLAQMSFGLSLGLFAGLLGIFCLLSCFIPTGRIERDGILFGILALAICALLASFSWALLVTCLLLMLLLLGFTVWGWDGSPEPGLDQSRGKRRYPWIAAGLTLGFFLFVSLWTVTPWRFHRHA